MMESAEDWYRCDGAELLRVPKIRCILVQREMRADLIVIRSVILQHATQLRFVKHDQVIEAFAPNRSDDALDVAVLPRRARRGRMITDPHCLNAMGVSWTEGAVAVTKHVTWRFIPGKGVSHLPSDPLGGRIVRHPDVYLCVANC